MTTGKAAVAVLTRNLRVDDNETVRRAGPGALVAFVDELVLRHVPRSCRRAWDFIDAALDDPGMDAVVRFRSVAELRRRVAPTVTLTFGDPFDVEAVAQLRRAFGAEAVTVVNDVSLVDPGSVKYYKVFSAFEKRVRAMLLGGTPTPRGGAVAVPTAPGEGVRREGLRLLRRAARLGDDYARFRDVMASDRGATGLGPYLARGVVGVREAWRSLGAVGAAAPGSDAASEAIRSQLVWREFYMHLRYHCPELSTRAWRADRTAAGMDDPRWWSDDARAWRAFREGRTGVPIVDAGVRQLLATGTMHNRARMIVSQFLTKDLRIDWRRGERWFASHLVDFDAANNAGNWQWNAGTGTDPEPFGKPRVFNPWLQAERHDPDAEYIMRWVPELRRMGATAREVHRWAHPQVRDAVLRRAGQRGPSSTRTYPAPIIESHAERREDFLRRLKVDMARKNAG